MKKFDCFRLDVPNQRLWFDGKQIAIPPKPFAVLRYLVENAGRLVSHDEFMDKLWPETFVQPQILRTYVLDLRKILKDDAGKPRFIQTLPKRGYCFVATVTDCADATIYGKKAEAVNHEAAPEFIGRESELTKLMAQLELLANRQRRVILVTGEAGIGKTALVDAFCRQAESSHSVSMARGQCVPGAGRTEEYYPVMEALRSLCSSPDGEAACEVLSAMAPTWLSHGTSSVAFSHSHEAREEPRRMIGDLCEALEKISAEKPLVLLFEDIEWADESTLHLISAIARRRANARLMIVATYGPTKGRHEHGLAELRQDLMIRRLCVELMLSPLSKMHVGHLLSRKLGTQQLPAGLNDFVVQRADGNPLFAIAILEHLISEAVLVPSDCEDQWKLRLPFTEIESSVPHGLAQMIELEIAHLSTEEQRILEAGSLMSVVFPAWAVAAAMQRDAGEIEEACEELARRVCFVERAGQDDLPDGTQSAFFVFAHGLYREVINQRQASSRRAKGHLRIANRLQELFVGRESTVAREAARHYEAGGEWRHAIGCLRAAASIASARDAYLDAADLLNQAIGVGEKFRDSATSGEANAVCDELKEIRDALRKRSSLSEGMIVKA